MVTLAKVGSLHARRQAAAFVRTNEAVKKLFAELGPRFQERKGGYTRILKLGNRLGDGAPMAIIEYLGYQAKPKKLKEEKGAAGEAAPKAEKKVKAPKKDKKQEAKAEKEVKKEEKKAKADKHLAKGAAPRPRKRQSPK
jgi:large subunit ribosomal protein L17